MTANARARWPRLLAPASVLLASISGLAVARGGLMRLAALALGVIAIGGSVAWGAARRVGVGFAAVEGPVLLLLTSTLVFRQRDAAALASNPLDSAGLIRVGCIAGALLLGALALTGAAATTERVTSRPFRLYAAYVAVVFVGAPLSSNPALTAYRGVELLTALVVLAGAYRSTGPDAVRRIERSVYLWFLLLLATAWVGVVLFPGRGLTPSRSPIPYQLHGVFPSISANGLGILGVVVAFWSLIARSRREPWSPIRRNWLVPAACFGFATLVLAQYRTGYVAVAVGLVAVAALKSRFGATWAMAGTAITISLWGAAIIETLQPVLLRGQTPDQAARLSSRLFFWTEAIPVWQESPWIGKGLLTATRFEVLAELGRTETSTIHGSWIEALVGTGIIGLALLAAMVFTIAARAIRDALGGGRLLPAILITLILVRSVTGTTFEVFGSFALLTGLLALSARDSVRVRYARAPNRSFAR